MSLMMGMMLATLAAHAGKLPEFMDAQHMAQWRAAHTPPAACEAQAPDELKLFFTGRPYDVASDSFLFKYRNYQPVQGRWTSVDPSGFPDGANNFQYCRNNPATFRDNDGLKIFFAETCTKSERKQFKSVLENLGKSGPTGLALMNAANAKDTEVHIDMSPKNEASGTALDLSSPRPTPATVLLNSVNANFASDEQNMKAEKFGETTKRPESVLAHELGHALLNLDDLGDIALIENPVRIDYGEHPREAYNGVKLSSISSTQLLTDLTKVQLFLAKYKNPME